MISCFRMIESTRNDPPVQFTALAYPSVIFLPHNRPDNSRVFPTYKELNVTSLLSFILSNLSPDQRLRLALSSCDTNCVAKLRLTATDKLSKVESYRRRLPESAMHTRVGLTLARQIKHIRLVSTCQQSLLEAL